MDLHNFHSYHPKKKKSRRAKMIIGSDDLLVVVSPQRGSISYSKAYNALLKKILKDTGENGYLIIYPGMVSKSQTS